MQKYWYTSKMKCKHNVKIDLKTGLYNCFNSHSLFCSFPCAFSFFSLFFNSSGQRRKCCCRRQGKECTFQGSCLHWDLDCIKIWVNHNRFASSQDTNRSILKWKAKSKWSTEVKKMVFWKEKPETTTII